MKHVVVIADTGWAIGRIHRDLAKVLASEYTFTYHTSGHFYMDKFLRDFRKADVCLTTYNHYQGMLKLFPSSSDRKKIAMVCHGYSELEEGTTNPLPSIFTYGVTSHVLSPRFAIPHHVVLTGMNPEEFTYTEPTGRIRTLGWCGCRQVVSKRPEWGHAIAKQTQLSISYAETLSYDALKEWYKTIDVLLVTAGPEPWKETGPLPPFEAIGSGVLVIGVPIGNFSLLPGPKFHTVEEAVVLVNELKANPTKVKALAKEQYDCVMAKWTYTATKGSWSALFDAVLTKTNQPLLNATLPRHYATIDAYLYINLAHREDRKKHIESQFEQANIPKERIQRIDAVERKGFGILGCVESHLKALEVAEAHPEWEWIAIFEDDFTFRTVEEGFSRVTSVLETKPDVLMLAQSRDELELVPTGIPTVMKVVSAKTTSGYIIHRSYLPTVRANFKESRDLLFTAGRWTKAYCLDDYWRRLQKTGQWYACTPSIGYQCESYSDIAKCVINYGC